MKKKLTAPAVLLLTAPLLTGCWGSGYYETANFRFDGTLPWVLNDAVCGENTHCAERLIFTAGGGTVSVYESANTLSAETLANDTGLAEKKELRCKYDAWEAVGDPQLDFRNRSMQQVYIWIAEEGHVLTLNCTLPEGTVGDFEINVQGLLDSVEYTGEPLQFESGEADAGNIHAAWSADWKPLEYSGAGSEGAGFRRQGDRTDFIYGTPDESDILRRTARAGCGLCGCLLEGSVHGDRLPEIFCGMRRQEL